MTVADLTPTQLFAIVLAAQVLFWLGLLGVREWSRLETRRERLVALAGIFFIFGVPVWTALEAMAP